MKEAFGEFILKLSGLILLLFYGAFTWISS